MEDAIAEVAELVRKNWQLIHSLAERWMEDSQESWLEGDPRYMMSGDDVRRVMARFRATG